MMRLATLLCLLLLTLAAGCESDPDSASYSYGGICEPECSNETCGQDDGCGDVCSCR
jgi:hypothetical protein